MFKYISIFFSLFLCSCYPVYMINSDTELEPGMLSVCWMSDGRADYSQESICENSEEILFERNRIPLIVYSAYEDDNIIAAINWINEELDCEIFRFDGAALHPDVRVYLNLASTNGSRFHGETYHLRLAGGRQVAVVSTFMLHDIVAIQYTIEHELGHVLGLAHDDFQYSVMFTFSRTNWNYHITTRDRRLIRERYCL